MAEQIVASVKRMREVIEGEQLADDLHDLIAAYARGQLYRKTGAQTNELRRRIVSLLAQKHFPLAQRTGIESARPILDRLGGRELIARGSRLRGRVLADFKRYHRSNLAVLEAELQKELGTLNAEVRAAFARASRDGVARNDLIADLLASDKAELKQLAKARRRVRAATRQLGSAEASGDRRLITGARRELRQAKQSVRSTKSFYARFETRVQAHARDAVRREAQRAQFASFKAAGFTGKFTWVSVNGSDACPSCRELHGESHTQIAWRGMMPGDGHTFCGDACMCQLVPEEYTRDNETLAEPVNPYRQG